MIIKKITLENIRSYEYQEIDFPNGSVLLSGDIGSGKTSVLLAIEFALFGLQPGQRGSSLLRNGATEGKVSMEFWVDDKSIIIERTLKKAKTISQDYTAITIDGVKQEMSVTEVKNKVLEVLNYPMEFAKKQNLLYKFTVYTPQEEMKQIILQDSETRMNTLRHVFGVDKYKKILENVSIFTTKLREEKRMKEGMISNLEADREDVLSKEEELETKNYNLISVEKEFFLKTERRKILQEEKENLFKKIEERNKFQQEVEKTNLVIANKKDSISSNNRLIAQLKEQLREIQNLQFKESEITKSEQELKMLKKEMEKFNEENLKINSQISSLNLKTDDSQKTEKNLSRLEICPTCLQNVDPIYKANIINKLDSDIVENNKLITKLNEDKKIISEKIINLNKEISFLQDKINELKIMKMRIQESQEREKRLKELENTNSFLEKDVILLNQHIELLKTSVSELNKYENIFKRKGEELQIALEEEKIVHIKVVELKKEIELFSKQIEEMKVKIKKTEEIKKQLAYMIELEDWLSKKFISLISFIERNVMVKLKKEFSKLFSDWFSTLVSDFFNIRLSDDFTPIIEQQDYEIDYEYLSGGERTAIALAYRLSLNQVINSFLSIIKTRDLIILDEPTDGFSEQQLDKMRDILQQLNVKQMIIVSHEQKIESFVDNVIKFRKEGGVTKVMSP
jgi:exonuclease SbcC